MSGQTREPFATNVPRARVARATYSQDSDSCARAADRATYSQDSDSCARAADRATYSQGSVARTRAADRATNRAWRCPTALAHAARAKVAMVVTLAAAVACTEAAPTVSDPGPTSGELVFRPCDITTGRGTLENAAECAEVEVPARRNVASSAEVSLSLKRFKQSDRVGGQLWLLAGGPGSAASDFEVDAEFYASLGTHLEVYFLDHRGTGRSTRLGCAAEEAADSASGEVVRDAEWIACASSLTRRWGDDLHGFNPTEAARDLGELIEKTRRADVPVYVYAVSYGTYLAQRYLQLYPTQPSGVILDSICAPGRCDLLLAFDRQFDATARHIFEMCAATPACAGELGAEPWSRVSALSAALGGGHCSELGWSATTLRQVLGMMTSIAGLRDYMPAVVKRAERCSGNDVLALARFRQFMSGIDTESSSFSQALSANIVLSEMAPRPLPLPADVAANVSGLFASIDAGPRLAGALEPWPTYERDEFYGKFAATNVPLLMLNGTLDPQTPLEVAQPVADFYRGPSQRFITIPYSPHTTLTQSLVDTEGHTCAADLVSQFLANPLTSIDPSCLSRVLPLDFSGVPAITRLLFGTDSAFADVPPSTTTQAQSYTTAPAPTTHWSVVGAKAY